MSVPTTASRSVDIAAPPEAVYDIVSDVTRTGEWSPECRSCEWAEGTPGDVGARFKGHNRQGPARWTTTAEVIAADRPREFAFATMNKDRQGTVWRYQLAPSSGGTTLTESFEAVSAPWLITFAEKYVLRGRQQQLEQGIDATLARIKAIAEPAG